MADLRESPSLPWDVLLVIIDHSPLDVLKSFALLNHDLYEECHPRLWRSQVWTTKQNTKLEYIASRPKILQSLRHLRISTEGVRRNMANLNLLLRLLHGAQSLTSLSIAASSWDDESICQALNTMHFPQLISLSLNSDLSDLSPFFERNHSVRHLLLDNQSDSMPKQSWSPNLECISVFYIAHLALIRDRPVSTVHIADYMFDVAEQDSLSSIFSTSTTLITSLSLLFYSLDPSVLPVFTTTIASLPSLQSLTLNIRRFASLGEDNTEIHLQAFESLTLLPNLTLLTWRIEQNEYETIPVLRDDVFMTLYASHARELRQVNWVILKDRDPFTRFNEQCGGSDYKGLTLRTSRYVRVSIGEDDVYGEGGLWKEMDQEAIDVIPLKSPFFSFYTAHRPA